MTQLLSNLMNSRPRAAIATDRTILTGQPDASFGNNAVTTSKYTYVNVIPKAIWNQFRRVSNFYFLIVAVISFIPNISPSSPITTTLPLVVVIGFGLARDVYEDILRKKEDSKVNNKLFQRYDTATKQYVDIKSRDIHVGHVLHLSNNMPIPCDVLLLKSSTDNNECFISTANLDGESNLKRKFIPFKHDNNSDIDNEFIMDDNSKIQMKPPTPLLYDIQGTYTNTQGNQVFPITENNVLLRGSILKNTTNIHALAIYNGKDTKLSMNMNNPPSKLGGIEKLMNHVVVALFLFLLLLTSITSILAGVWQSQHGQEQWYMGDNRSLSGVIVALRSLGTFIILYHTFVPVSLFVTLEFVRLVQGFFISNDPLTGFADVRANNLNETLGYVNHIFSDKTGTLTQNIMKFKSCVIPSSSHSDGIQTVDAQQLQSQLALNTDNICTNDFDNQIISNDDQFNLRKLTLAMALTHDVMPATQNEDHGESIDYEGESPDEVALVKAAYESNIKLTRRPQRNFEISVNQQPTTLYETESILEFSSDRKRMSVIVRQAGSQSESMHVLCKGADSVILPLLCTDDEKERAMKASDSLSRKGLRTLVYAYKKVSGDVVERLKQLQHSLEQKQNELDQVMNEIESKLSLIGITGVEDKLQDAVEQTIDDIRNAHIKIWVLTGDKIETTENIGYSSKLLIPSMNIGIIKDVQDERELMEYMKKHESDLNAIIIDGISLTCILNDYNHHNKDLQKQFLQFCSEFKTVICARVTPLQKSQIIQLVQSFNPHLNTLAIGDGGNDVSMIQQASIGVGIKGKEGTQAARASDYALNEFKNLWSLLAVHGRFSYLRTSGVIHISLYKNVFFSTTQFLFQFYCFASGTTLHNEWLVTSWNAILTLIPPFLYGIFEKDLRSSTVLRIPSIYNHSDGKLFNLRTVAGFTLGYSLYHANVLFWFVYLNFGGMKRVTFKSGMDSGFFHTGLIVSILSLCIVLTKFLISSHLWTYPVLIGIAVSFSLLWLLIFIFPTVAHEAPLEGMLSMVWSCRLFHLIWPLVFVVVFIPDFVIKSWSSQHNNNSTIRKLQILESRKQL